MLEISEHSTSLDHLRVPVTVVGGDRPAGPRLNQVTRSGQREAAVLAWPKHDGAPRLAWLHDMAVHAAVVSDREAQAWLASLGRGPWHREHVLRDRDGTPLGSVWRAADGSRFLPFDPDAAVQSAWTETYLEGTSTSGSRRVRTAAMAVYYALRPALPRRLQLLLRRAYSRVQGSGGFPRWPVEPSLHELYDRLLGWLADVSGEPVPYLAPWPGGHDWALVLTHDVETAKGLRLMPVLRDIEKSRGLDRKSVV